MTHTLEHTPTDLAVYEGCGNRFIIAPFATDSVSDLQHSPGTLAYLRTLGENTHSDSVMVLTNALNADTAMSVFEPHAYRAEIAGSGWSTMCGNGIRAVAQYLQDCGTTREIYRVQTGAGLQRVARGTQANEWRVDMGFFSTDTREFPQYVRGSVTSRYPNLHIGLHSQQQHKGVDGEPHAVIFLDRTAESGALVQLAQTLGEPITRDAQTFPLEINVSVVSAPMINETSRTVRVVAATFERNIYYVTQACGTASTVIGALLFERFALENDWHVDVQMPGGILHITRDDSGRYYLSGDVRHVRQLQLP